MMFIDQHAGVYNGIVLKQINQMNDTLSECVTEFGNRDDMHIYCKIPIKIFSSLIEKEGYEGTLIDNKDSIIIKLKYGQRKWIGSTNNFDYDYYLDDASFSFDIQENNNITSVS